jgi:hypothetical protein
MSSISDRTISADVRSGILSASYTADGQKNGPPRFPLGRISVLSQRHSLPLGRLAPGGRRPPFTQDPDERRDARMVPVMIQPASDLPDRKMKPSFGQAREAG